MTELTYTHSATTTTDSHMRVAPLAGNPTNWVSPVDYSHGTAVVRLEVFTKPTTTATRFQICFEGSPSYACTDQAPAYTAPGVYTWTTQFTSFYQYNMVDWTKPVSKVALILKDTMNGKPAPENVGATTSALYMPTNLRVTVTLVSPGGTYVPPAPPIVDAGIDAGTKDAGVVDAGMKDAGTVADAGMDAGTSADDAGSDAGTTPNDAGTMPTTDAGHVADAGTMTSADGGTMNPDDMKGGCSCNGSGGGILLFGAALLVRRRSKR